MNEKAIELLEKAKKCLHYQSTGFDYIDQALVLLKQPKCKTCGDTGKIPRPMPKTPHPCNYINIKESERTIPCPDCQQPLAGKFTTQVRMNLEGWNTVLSLQEDCRIRTIVDWLKKSCDIIDQAEADKAELLGALDHIKEILKD